MEVHAWLTDSTSWNSSAALDVTGGQDMINTCKAQYIRSFFPLVVGLSCNRGLICLLVFGGSNIWCFLLSIRTNGRRKDPSEWEIRLLTRALLLHGSSQIGQRTVAVDLDPHRYPRGRTHAFQRRPGTSSFICVCPRMLPCYVLHIQWINTSTVQEGWVYPYGCREAGPTTDHIVLSHLLPSPLPHLTFTGVSSFVLIQVFL